MTQLNRHRVPNKKEKSCEVHTNWAISYIDLLTILLCFFIMFFQADKFDNGQSPIDKILLQLENSQNKAGSNTAGNQSTRTPASQVSKAKTSPLAQLSQTLSAQKIEVKASSDGRKLQLDFSKTSFFQSGSYKLRDEAKELMTQTINYLRPYKNDIQVIVQGHSDPRMVSARTRRKKMVNDNWQLSALRATTVVNMFLMHGFDQKQLSAEGVSSGRTIANENDHSYQRRISITIEEVKK